jgi:hypothetical protein
MKSGLARALVFGGLAGIVATIVMDIFVALAMTAMGNPAAFMFVFIGQVAAKFFSLLNMPIAGGPGLGLLLHYLFGTGYGALFCGALARWPRLKPPALGGAILLGILYIEIASQPFLASAPLLLKMTASDTLQWYGLSTAMHAIYGVVVGLLQHYRPARWAAGPDPVRA